MRYKQFLIKGDFERKLGILGETHCYNKKESDFARKIVKEYNILAVEGSKDIPSAASPLGCVSILLAPSIMEFSDALERPVSNETAKDIGESEQKKIYYLEPGISYQLSLFKILVLFGFALATVPFVPWIYYSVKKYGKEIEKANPPASIKRIVRYIFDADRRDRLMSKNALKVWNHTKENMLIVCGLEHLEGIVQNLHQHLSLKEAENYEFF
ncbi:hypothetical protein KY306_01230 [Candidatus Woesearchaeota archaeon]|nr:hypothetical protein [Candidatus Woesearchaeota archaeon]